MVDKKKMVVDMMLNIVAAAIPVAIIQLIVFPVMGKTINSNDYGLMISLYSILVMIPGSLSSVLATVRIVHAKEYEKEYLEGDFNVILLRWSWLNAIAIFVIFWFYCDNHNLAVLSLDVLIAALMLIRGYMEIQFKIELQYIKVVINNGILGVGYLIGLYISVKTSIWEFIFLFGHLSSFLYCNYLTGYLKEKRVKTHLYNRIVTDCRHLTVATVIGNLITYADKIVLYPIMGGHNVAIYYTATLVGKIIGMLTGPINSVVLTYLSKFDLGNKKIFVRIIMLSLPMLLIFYFITLWVTEPILSLLYPQWLDEVLAYVPITTATIMVGTLTSVLQPFILKYREMKWQTLVSASSSAIYFLAALVLLKRFGLMGFCIGCLIGSVFKLVFIIFIFFFSKPIQE